MIFTLQMKDLVVHSLVQTWDTLSLAMLAVNLEWCWEEKDLTNQNLITTVSAYTLSWFKGTRLSTILLAARKFHCCLAFFLFQSSKLETLYLLDSTWTIRPLVNYNSDHYQKMFSWYSYWIERHERWKNILCIGRHDSSCFDVQKSL